MYQAVVARRLQWDNLVWQVPILSLTAQAFLFTIALGGDSSRVARVVASLLSLVATVLSVTLMARHRQAELFDAHWLEAFEVRYFGKERAVHGRAFRAARNAEPVDAGWLDRIVPLWPGYRTWVIGLGLFGLAAVAVLVLTALAPEALVAQP